MTFGTIRSDASKNIIADFGWEYESRGNNSAKSHRIQPGISVRPFSALKLGVSANYSENTDDLQFVTSISDIGERSYILGTIEQKTLGLTFRADLNISPELSIQYYGSPFISKGKYYDFKLVTEPDAKEYSHRFVYIDPEDPYFSMLDPDFNFYQFRSNLVAKWEYRLGSFIYLVWSSDRTGFSGDADRPLGDSFGLLGKSFPDNIFLVKLNYWFSL